MKVGHCVFGYTLFFIGIGSFAQDTAGIDKTKAEISVRENKKFFSPKSLAIPAVFIGYGFISLGNGPLDDLDKTIREEIVSYKIPFKTRVDDYLEYAPVVTVYALDAAGIKAKHSFIDRSIVYTASVILSNQLVSKLKRATRELRPDGSTYNSFPSGHTATAFTGAEFMHQEYGSRSLWYSFAGYTMAGVTGGLRVLNNRHWLSDVIAGAGFGILSVKFSYWVYYKVVKKKVAKLRRD